VDTLVKRLRISRTEARRMVDERFNRINPPGPTEDTSTYLIDKPATPRLLTHSEPIEQPAPFDHKKHLEGIEVARARRGDAPTLRRPE
jgi:hypothetical protein